MFHGVAFLVNKIQICVSECLAVLVSDLVSDSVSHDGPIRSAL